MSMIANNKLHLMRVIWPPNDRRELLSKYGIGVAVVSKESNVSSLKSETTLLMTVLRTVLQI